MLLEYEHSFFYVFYFWAGVVYTAKFVAICDVKSRLLLKVRVPVKELRGLIFWDICLEKLPKFTSEICSPLLTAYISKNGVVHRICNVWKGVVL